MNTKIPKNPNLDIKFNTEELKEIWLAGGCFWGLEAYMARIYGVYDVTSGYANGQTEHPTYQEVCTQTTGHAEAVHIKYDPERVTLETLLMYYFKVIDPTIKNRQGNDKGPQYRTAIYYQNPADLQVIQNMMMKEQEKYSDPIVTEVEPLRHFFLAEEMHQDYLEKNPTGYCHIDFNQLNNLDLTIAINNENYTKPSDQALKEKLTDLQYNVTQNSYTEKPFSNPYWNHFEKGIYTDIVTGEPLFYSNDKFDSGCGWPSFSKPILDDNVKQIEDRTFYMTRIEVRSKTGDGHLGHVFDDGPEALGGKRYCINSAALRFIPYEEMEQEGYGYLKKYIY